MPRIEILGSGVVDDRGSAFAPTVELRNGHMLCSFSVGGGPGAGRTELFSDALSTLLTAG